MTRRLRLLVLAVLMVAFAATPAPAASRFELVEATIADIRAALDSGLLTSKELVQLYLNRIEAYNNSGPMLNAIRELNPNALAIAEEMDRIRAQARQGRPPRSRAAPRLGPLFGIPVLLKDNVNTRDMPTTAGSVALRGSIPLDDAFIAKKLRAAGAIILGKANLTEFANYLTNGMPAGYSSLGGYVFNPYNPGALAGSDGRPALSPGGSSSGSAAAVAANLVTVAVGTETSGSILSPGNQNSVVGIKPTVGLISREGIIPIAASQDIAGPFGRTVADAAILLGALTGIDPNDPITSESAGRSFSDYTPFLQPGALLFARIGVPRANYWAGLNAGQRQIMEDAVARLRSLGAQVFDADIPTSGMQGGRGSYVLQYEFKRDLNAYLTALGPQSPIKALADVIAFNSANATAALKYGQTLALASQATDLEAERPRYLQERATDVLLSKDQGIDAIMDSLRLDALVFPSNGGAGIAARAGYPSVIVPAGYLDNGAPYGITFTGRAYSEPILIALAYSFEQATKHRRPPASTPPLPGEVKTDP
jgi:amidase